MSFQDCGVEFHGSPQGVLYSGREITGVFHIRQPEPKKLKGLYFKIIGKTTTAWSEEQGSGKYSETVDYSGEECHIDSCPMTLLSGYRIEKGGVTIGEGLSTFNFSFSLPREIPSSFEGDHGKTEYKMKVVAERSKKIDKSKKFPFTVICSNDLNLDLNNRMPIKEVLTKRISTHFDDQRSLEMIIDLSLKGYVPGQQLPIKCLVKNNSGVLVSSVIFRLERIVTYFSENTRSKTENNKIFEFIGGQVDKDSESALEVELSIPPVPPSSVKDTLITMQYFVTVQAITTGMLFNLDTKIPVTIGTVLVYTRKEIDPSLLIGFNQLDITVPFTTCPDRSQLPGPSHPGFLSPGVPPLPTPTAPFLYSDEKSGL